jgi:hypothetical protein
VSIATAKVEEIRDAAQQVVDSAEELIGYREDPDADREDKATANEEFEDALVELVATLPKKLRSDD